MKKEKILQYSVYFILIVLILLFIVSLILPTKFEVLLSQSELFLNSYFALEGWVLVLGAFFAFFGVIKLLDFFASFYPKRLSFHKYKNDIFKETQWKWKWQDSNIENLWCYCPSCNQELAYQCDHLLFKTEFLCQKCEKHISSYDGDNINYVLSKVKAEIRRIAQRQLQDKK